jgi:putative transposase
VFILLKSFKTEINPTDEQKIKIHKTIGTCRYIYNFYLSYNKELYDKSKKFISGKSFSVWLNNEYLPSHPELSWIKEVSSKAVKQSIIQANTAYTRFFKQQSGFPKFKKKNKSDVKMYFVKTDAKSTIWCERHRIKIPTLGWVRVKEKGYLPTTKSGHVIKSGTVSMKAGRYYVSVLVEIPDRKVIYNTNEGIGIDLGLKDFAIVSNGKTYKNVNKSVKLKKLEKQLKREQRYLSRKYESLKKRSKQRKEEATRQNIQKQILRVQKLHHRLDNIRTDYINKIIIEIVKTKPSYITIEDLNVSGMMKNRHLSKAVASQKFYEFKTKLKAKCAKNGIELRVVDRFYPSSKLCHCCGAIKKDLKLSDRIYKCSCGYIEDRDFNAALNLRDAITYTVA